MPGNLEALPSITISDGHMFVGGDTHLQGSIQLGQVLTLLAFWYNSTNTHTSTAPFSSDRYSLYLLSGTKVRLLTQSCAHSSSLRTRMLYIYIYIYIYVYIYAIYVCYIYIYMYADVC
jgi:hypothetical protein